MSFESLITQVKSLWAKFQGLRSDTKSNLFILAGILLFVIDTASCFSRYGEWERNPANLRSWAPGPWHFWPDFCAIWLWLVIFGVWTRFRGFPGGRISAEEFAELTDESRKNAFLRHLLPVLSQYDKNGTEVAVLQREFFRKEPLPFPTVQFGESAVTLKVLPPGEAKPKLAAQMFEQLHRIKSKLWFEFVVEQGEAYFRIKCTAEDEAVVRHQLSVYFPCAVIETLPFHKADDVDQLHPVVWYRYRYAPAAGKTLESFPIDPYAQLFALADQLSEEQIASFRIECWPFPTATIATVINTLFSPHNEFKASYNRGDGWKKFLQQVQAKAPTWAMVCAVAVDTAVADSSKAKEHFAELDSFLAGMNIFFNQYQNNEQGWEQYTLEELNACRRYPDYEPTHRSLPFCLVSCQELAALAHFPGKGALCQRLAKAAAPTPAPPPLYTKPD